MLVIGTAACGGAKPPRAGTDAGPAPAIARATDGRAQLAIPDGALPAGVRPDDIRITSVTFDAAARGAGGSPPLAVYRLEPDGLRLNAPVTLTINVPDPGPGSAVPLVVNVGRDGAELARNISATTDPATGMLSVSGEFTHFSTAVVLRGLFSMAIDDPGDRVVGETFRIGATVTALEDIAVVEGAGIRHEIRLAREPFDLVGTFDALRGFSPSRIITPNDVPDRPPLTRVLDSSHTVQQSFTCVREGDSSREAFWIGHFVQLTFVYEMRSVTPGGGGPWVRFSDTIRNYEPSPVRHCRAAAPPATDVSTPSTNRPPDVRPIRAFFDPGRFTTTYDVIASDPDGDTLTYNWSGANCGDAAPAPGGEAYRLRWSHPHPPCDPTTEHADVQIIVEVGDSRSTVRCTYQGAADGIGPPCEVTRR